MRRSVVTTMSGVSLVVVGLSLHESNQVLRHVTGLSTAPGIVVAGPSPTAQPDPTLAARRAGSSSPRPTRTSASPRPAATHHRTTTASRTTAPKPSPKPSPKPASSPTYTVTGYADDSGYGPIQVQVKIRNHRIVAADAIQYPTGGRDSQYNDCAIPQLNSETLQAQSARIDVACGASYTWQGYTGSLQDALDQAHKAGIF